MANSESITLGGLEAGLAGSIVGEGKTGLVRTKSPFLIRQLREVGSLLSVGLMSTYFLLAPITYAIKDTISSVRNFRQSQICQPCSKEDIVRLLRENGVTKSSLNFDPSKLNTFLYFGGQHRGTREESDSSLEVGATSSPGALSFVIPPNGIESDLSQFRDRVTHEYLHQVYDHMSRDEREDFIKWARWYIQKFDQETKNKKTGPVDLSHRLGQMTYFFPDLEREADKKRVDFSEIFAYTGEYFLSKSKRDKLERDPRGYKGYGDFISDASGVFGRFYRPDDPEPVQITKEPIVVDGYTDLARVIPKELKLFASFYPLKSRKN